MHESLATTAVPTRRRVLQTLAGAGGLLASALLPSAGAAALTSSEGHLRSLDLAATTAALGLTFYRSALTESTFQLGDAGTRQLDFMLLAHRRDARQVHALGGRVLSRFMFLPDSVYTDASVFVQTGLHLERASAQFYLAATRDLAAHNKPEIIRLLAHLAAHASQRQVQLAHLAGLDSEEATLGWEARSTSQALDALAVYLEKDRDGFQQLRVSA
ncbi:hypothetical protein [Deinococcus sp.]|uniref:hypothetical protein n=1 Tax=Deinococcus sp. TaxID=47478 RepID=UPI003CC5F821